MSGNKQNTIKIEVQPVDTHPEGYFNDLIEDGCTVNEALNVIVEGELVYAKLHQSEEFPCNEWVAVEIENLGDHTHKVVLEEIDWERNLCQF